MLWVKYRPSNRWINAVRPVLRSRSRHFRVAPESDFFRSAGADFLRRELYLLGKQKRKALYVEVSSSSVQFIKINMIQYIMLKFYFFTAQNYKFLCLEPKSEPPGAALFCL